MANLTCTVTKAWQLCIMDDLNGVRKRTYVIDKDLLHEGESGAHFLTLSRKDNTTRRIMTMLARDEHTTGHADDGFTALSMCDIPEQLAKLRNRAMRVAVLGDMVDHLPTKWGRIKRLKRWRAAMATMPEIVEVMTPATNDIPSITLKIIASTTGPVQMEITDQSLSWLTKSIASQVASGEVHSGQSKAGRTSDACDAIDGDGTSEASSEDCHCHPCRCDGCVYACV